jgi:hypothetical protein
MPPQHLQGLKALRAEPLGSTGSAFKSQVVKVLQKTDSEVSPKSDDSVDLKKQDSDDIKSQTHESIVEEESFEEVLEKA